MPVAIVMPRGSHAAMVSEKKVVECVWLLIGQLDADNNDGDKGEGHKDKTKISALLTFFRGVKDLLITFRLMEIAVKLLGRPTHKLGTVAAFKPGMSSIFCHSSLYPCIA